MATLPGGTPLGRLTVVKVYQYFDGPKLFSCSSATGQHYLAFWLGDETGADRWLYVPISPSRIAELEAGRQTLHESCSNPEDGFVWVVAIPLGTNGRAAATAWDPAQLAKEDLPAEDTYLSREHEAAPTT